MRKTKKIVKSKYTIRKKLKSRFRKIHAANRNNFFSDSVLIDTSSTLSNFDK